MLAGLPVFIGLHAGQAVLAAAAGSVRAERDKTLPGSTPGRSTRPPGAAPMAPAA